MKINRYIVYIFAFLSLVLVGTSFASATVQNSINSSKIISVYNSNASNATVNNAIVQSDNIIISKVGSSYFNKYLNYIDSHSVKNGSANITYVYFSYAIPYKTNSSTVSGIILPNLPILKLNAYVGIINNKKFVYFGPSKPYYINISAKNASNYAVAYGLPYNGLTYSYITYGYAKNATNQTGYSVVWAVLGNRPTYLSSNYYLNGVYLSIVNGSILGEYKVLPNNFYNPRNYLLGNFSIFNYSNVHYNVANNYSAPTTDYISNTSTGTTILYTNVANDMGPELILVVIAFGIIGTYLIKNISK